MMDLEAPWIGYAPDDDEETEEYAPEYYPICDCDEWED